MSRRHRQTHRCQIPSRRPFATLVSESQYRLHGTYCRLEIHRICRTPLGFVQCFLSCCERILTELGRSTLLLVSCISFIASVTAKRCSYIASKPFRRTPFPFGARTSGYNACHTAWQLPELLANSLDDAASSLQKIPPRVPCSYRLISVSEKGSGGPTHQYQAASQLRGL